MLYSRDGLLVTTGTHFFCTEKIRVRFPGGPLRGQYPNCPHAHYRRCGMKCKFCRKDLKGRKRRNTYCTIQCYQLQTKYEFILIRPPWVLSNSGDTSNYIKNYLLDRYNSSCQSCGWSEINPVTKKVPLEIHHIDGDWKNNKPSNIQILCPNCHAITETYGILNRGNGRRLYRIKYHEEKNMQV